MPVEHLEARTVADLMHRHFIALSPQDSLCDAERTMRLARVRSLPVLSDGKLVGLASHRDVICALLRRLIDAAEVASLQVRDVTVSVRASVSPETPIDRAAARLCAAGRGCLAVVESSPRGERMLGVLTESDLLRAGSRLGR